jgi:hypothetical protein
MKNTLANEKPDGERREFSFHKRFDPKKHFLYLGGAALFQNHHWQHQDDGTVLMIEAPSEGEVLFYGPPPGS